MSRKKREKMVTRTFKMYTMKVKVFDTTTEAIAEKSFTSPAEEEERRIKDFEKTENCVVVKTLETTIDEIKYGMTVSDFFKHSHKLSKEEEEEEN